MAGFCLLNDWSARDIQSWEYQPLGPFLSKNFATTISPWVITPEALAPFRAEQDPRPDGDPRPLPYLWDDRDQREGAFDLDLEVFLMTAGLREKGLRPHRIAHSSTRHMYWTVAQLIAHHSSNGCNLQPGDLLARGRSLRRRQPASVASSKRRARDRTQFASNPARSADFSKTVMNSSSLHGPHRLRSLYRSGLASVAAASAPAQQAVETRLDQKIRHAT